MDRMYQKFRKKLQNITTTKTTVKITVKVSIPPNLKIYYFVDWSKVGHPKILFFEVQCCHIDGTVLYNEIFRILVKSNCFSAEQIPLSFVPMAFDLCQIYEFIDYTLSNRKRCYSGCFSKCIFICLCSLSIVFW